MNSQRHIPTNKYIYSLLDNLENKLNRYTNYTSYGNDILYNQNNYYFNNNNNIDNNNNNNYINGNNQLYEEKNKENNDLRKIIIKEFNTLILPYQKDLNKNINNLESKINSINLKIDKINNNNNIFVNNDYFEQIKLKNNNYDEYISREEYETKMKEIDNQNNIMNSIIINLKNIIEKKINENNKSNYNILNNSNYENNNLNDKKGYDYVIKEIKYNQNNILDELNNFKKEVYKDIELLKLNPSKNLKEYDIKVNNILEDLKGVKEDSNNLNQELFLIKENINKNKINDYENKSKEIIIDKSFNEKYFINEIQNQNNKILKIEANLKNIEENNDINISKLKKIISDFELQLNNIKNLNSDFGDNINKSNINNSRNNMLFEEVKKNYMQELKKENEKYFNDINLKIDSKNEEIFKLFEQYDVAINNLNTKMEKIKNNFEIDNKKKFNHLNQKIEKSIIELNESNLGFINESRLAPNIIGNESINNIKTQINNQNLKFEKFEGEIKDKLIEINEQIIKNEQKISLLEDKMLENKKINNIMENNKGSNMESKKGSNMGSNNSKINYTNEKNKEKEEEEKYEKKTNKEEKKESILSIESLLIN